MPVRLELVVDANPLVAALLGGQSLEGVGHGKVRVQSLISEKLWVQVETDRQGHYAVEVHEGRYQVALSGFREKGAGRTIAVQAGQVAEVALRAKLPTGLQQPAGPGRGHWQSLGVAEGLSLLWVRDILQDRAGNLWVAAIGGLSRYDGQQWTTFTTKDGLAHDAVSQVLQTHNGDMWIATEEGLTRYRPRLSPPPPIYLKDVVADHHYGPAAEIRLPSSQKLLGFEFQGLSFKTRPGQMAYVYKLEAHDSDWRVTRENRVEYTDLPVGNYTFQVKAVDRDLNYSEQPATVAVEVFYQAIVSPVRLAEIHLQDLFASFYKTYNTQPLGSVQVINDSPDSVTATLSFFLPDYMRRPSEQPLMLSPQFLPAGGGEGAAGRTGAQSERNDTCTGRGVAGRG